MRTSLDDKKRQNRGKAIKNSIDFLIIGGQRALSTRLNDLLRAHPQVSSPRGEVTYFEDPYYAYARAAPPLPRLAKRLAPDMRLGFKRADLLSRPECPPRIAAARPDVRLLVSIREPISRAVSAYHHLIRTGCLPALPINEGLDKVLRGELTDRYPWAPDIVSSGMYATHLSRYLEYFDRGQILIVIDDDFRAEPRGVLRKAYEHIQVEPSFLPADIDRRSNSGVYSLPRLRLLKLGSRFLYSHQEEYTVIRANYAGRAANRAIWLLDRAILAPFVRESVPVLNSDILARLKQIFLPDVQRLEAMLGRPLPSWQTSPHSAK